MKQNERILVYLVTGFLAVILVVAVFFGREGQAAGKPNSDETVRGLGQILDRNPVSGAADAGGEVSKAGQSRSRSPEGQPEQKESTGAGELGGKQSEVTPPPLVASLPVAASARVAQVLGESRRDRNVRIVWARPGDSLSSLVQRWCGKLNPFLDEAKSLNENLTILRPDQKVVVPWVDDDVVFAAYESRQPRLLAGSGRPEPAIRPGSTPSVGSTPTFQVPGGSAGNERAGKSGPAAAAGSVSYVVQKNDSLWKIAARRYGNRNAPRMIKAIKELNGLTSDALKPDQKLMLPAGS